MKKAIALIVTLMLVLSLLAGCGAPKELDKDVVILYTNDVHCAVDDNIGYAGLAAYKAEVAAEDCYVTLVDAGDAIQGAPIGTFSDGEYLIDIMNKVGYDIAVPGNHEFDYGMEQFLSLTEKADFAYTSCNFNDLKTGKTVFDPYVMKDYNGVKVAYVGICTPRTITSSTPAYFQNESREFIYDFYQDATGGYLYTQVQDTVNAARKAGAQYVIAVSHLGIEAETSPWTSTEVIAATTGIDAFIDGHSHSTLECERVLNKEGQSVVLTSTGTKLEAIGRLVISKDGTLTSGLITGYEAKDADVDAYIKEIQSQYEAVLATVVAKSEQPLYITDPVTGVRIVRNAETNLGDLCADAYLWATGADVAFVNGGGVRADVAEGDLTYNDILTVQPFGNAVCMVEATGQEILDALEMGARNVPSENGGFLQVAGLTYEIDTRIASTVTLDENGMFASIGDARRVQNVMIGDEPLDPAATYTVACHDYLLKNGGDGYTMFQDNTLLLDCIMLDNQALSGYITEGLNGVIGSNYADPYGAGRIVELQ